MFKKKIDIRKINHEIALLVANNKDIPDNQIPEESLKLFKRYIDSYMILMNVDTNANK